MQMMMRWIKISERLPNRFVHVIVACDDGTVPRALMVYDGHFWKIGSTDLTYDHPVRYWMPMPEGPKYDAELLFDSDWGDDDDEYV